MSRKLGFVVSSCVLMAAVLVPAAGVSAAETCTFSEGVLSLTSDAAFVDDGSGTFPYFRHIRLVQSGTALQLWLETDVPEEPDTLLSCGSPTVSNTTAVTITMTSDAYSLVHLDMRGGEFAPAGMPTAVAVSIDQSAGFFGEVRVHAHASGGQMTAGANGLNLDGDNDVDVTFNNTGTLELIGSAVADTMSLGGGKGTGAATTLHGSVFGAAGADVIRGGADEDDLAGGDGNDKVFGGAGHDFLGTESGWPSPDDGADQLFGESGDDGIGGGPGNDVVSGGPGADELFGDAGIDTVTYSGASAGVRVSLDGTANDGTFVNSVSEEDNVAATIENQIGSAFADRLNGRPGSANVRNVLSGGNGNDLINGLDGNDVLSGGAGTNTLNGGPGIDTLNGGSARDVMSGGPGGDTAKGNGGNDAISGNDGDDHLFGHDGADTLNGGAGTDECRGGAGANTLTACEVP